MLPQFFTEDHVELIELLNKHDVEYLLIGGIAVNYYGYSRSTGEVDFFFRREPDNAERLYCALGEFFGDGVPGLSNADDLLVPDLVLQFGLPPHRVDLVNDISGIDFETAWSHRILDEIKDIDVTVPIIELDDLLANKRASGRAKDLDDLEYLSDVASEEP
ncbi:MAG: DUF6036 family nucleotidyltransferase [Myxococcota bacterium]